MHLETPQSMLRQNQVDAVALGPGPHVAYVVNVTPHADERPCLLVATPTGAAILMPELVPDAQVRWPSCSEAGPMCCCR